MIDQVVLMDASKILFCVISKIIFIAQKYFKTLLIVSFFVHPALDFLHDICGRTAREWGGGHVDSRRRQ